MSIEDALRGISAPVSADPYAGSADTYVTYQCIGQVGAIYAEGREAETCVAYAVDIWTGVSYLDTLREVKAALEAAGYIVTVDMTYYNSDVGRTQVSLTATREGDIFA